MLKKLIGVAVVAAGVAALAIPAGAAARTPKVHITKRHGVVAGKPIAKKVTRGEAQVSFDGTNFSVSAHLRINAPGNKYWVQVNQYDKIGGRLTQVSTNVGCELTVGDQGIAVCRAGDLGPMAGHWATRTTVDIVSEDDHSIVAKGLMHR